MKKTEKDNIRELVREHYGKTAGRKIDRYECSSLPSCCDSKNRTGSGVNTFEQFGYPAKEVLQFHGEESSGLCCGNPLTTTGLKIGETVLDIGSGSGFDCYLAAKKVRKTGYVIGNDMTLEIVRKARENMSKWEFDNVEFRLGEIEKMLNNAGFQDIRIKPIEESRNIIREWAQGSSAEDFVVSATIEATKP